MTCEEFVELVTSYLEETLPVEQRAAFDEHLARCPGCERYLAQFQQTIDVLGELPQEALSASARAELLSAFAQWRRDTGSHPG